ncbi:17193_t:CDS:2 [Funneliformis geosporum]|uniref:17193_t:CDS:1 n=1 Tax=Funneliformis geosporum TaxID=1117311 RepID=A0A9W4WKN1_9GLOM|nr:17193_t:CDS:2 [Funneliformis geosporum]
MVVRVLDDYYLAITAIITVGYQLIFFTIAYTFQIDSVTDFGGGSNVALLAILSFVLGQTWYVRQIIATTFAVLWGVRLGLFCLYRMLKSGKDSRFENIRSKFASLLFFFVLQMIWVWIISLPVIFLNSPRISNDEYGGKDVKFGSATDVIGVIVFTIGILFESIADLQKGFGHGVGIQIISVKSVTGIFLLCLQPTIAGVGTNAAYASISSPAFTIFLLMFLSGMPLNERPAHEKQWKQGNWTDYSKYLERTSALIPFPPNLYEPLPQMIKSTLFLEFPLYRFIPELENGDQSGLTRDGESSGNVAGNDQQ